MEQKFEHTFRTSDGGAAKEISEILEDMEKHGWELVSVIDSQYNSTSDNSNDLMGIRGVSFTSVKSFIRLFFKRPFSK